VVRIDGCGADHDPGAVRGQHVALVLADLVRADEDAGVAPALGGDGQPTPVLPLVGSTMVPPGCSDPSRSAASIIRTAIRSFTEPPGLRYSTLASTRGVASPGTRDSRTSGVLPISSVSEFTYCTA
jgi:hypothetical protein